MTHRRSHPKIRLIPAAPSWRERMAAGWRSRLPVVLYTMRFACWLLVYVLWSLTTWHQELLLAVARTNAQLCADLLSCMGASCHVEGATLNSPTGAVLTVLPLCTALELVWFYCAALLTHDSPLCEKAAPLVLGVCFLLLLNCVRVTSLFLCRMHFPASFGWLHEEFWSLALNLAVLLLFMGWMSSRKRHEA